MKKEWNLNWLIRITTILLLFLCGYLFLKLAPIWEPVLALLLTIAVPVLTAALITYLLHPIVEKIHEEGLPRALAILIIYFLFFGGIGYAAFKGTPYAIKQTQELADNLPQLVETYRVWINELYRSTSNFPPAFQTRIDETLHSVEVYVNEMLNAVLEIFKKLIGSLFLLFITPFLVFYFLKDFEDIKKAVWYITPKKWRTPGKQLLNEIDESLGNYIRGQFLVISALVVLGIIGFWIIGMPYPILLGVIVGITDLIPYFGPIIGAFPALVIAMTVSMKMLIYVVGLILILQFIESNILSPYIVGRSLHIHPVIIIFGLLIGGEVGGIPGLILAVPILAVLKVVIKHVAFTAKR
ncbi:AI-2E family transporter [Pseudalkalibacillus caeni]|uniref:AI-2E family transporter n=1 Tax=Exobacillus caeni TaxID=2574798 RepID=A0A5R9FFC0_9BACL|nr:AI-2E family transporter [Pseudalkalibacillus caeni]TLS39294.1 AI-2E family transporter [Pseudalkalibacillus caeni]